jgi:Arc/MetJ-type ribon-helix-helix transcriptional regulator
MSKDNDRIVTFHIPVKLLDKVQDIARREMLSRSDVLRRAVVADLRQRGDLEETN